MKVTDFKTGERVSVLVTERSLRDGKVTGLYNGRTRVQGNVIKIVEKPIWPETMPYIVVSINPEEYNQMQYAYTANAQIVYMFDNPKKVGAK